MSALRYPLIPKNLQSRFSWTSGLPALTQKKKSQELMLLFLDSDLYWVNVILFIFYLFCSLKSAFTTSSESTVIFATCSIGIPISKSFLAVSIAFCSAPSFLPRRNVSWS